MENLFKYITKETLTYESLLFELKDYYKTNKIQVRPTTLDADTERCLKIISNIMFRQRVYQKPSNKNYKEEWVKLNATILLKQLGKHYKRLLSFLTSSKILLVYKNHGKESYSVNDYSKKYMLNPIYTAENTIVCPFNNKKVIRAIQNAKDLRVNNLSPIYKHLQSFLPDLTLNEYNYLPKHEVLIKYFYSQENINDLIVDTSGRQYTKLTNLPKEARKHLRYKGKKLVAIDIANSQPLLLLALIKNSKIISKAEYEKYEMLVNTGNFYNYLSNKLGLVKTSKFKKELFKHIFFNYKHNYTNKTIKIFQQEFPGIFNWILQNSTYKDELSFQLRKKESDIWIQQITKFFMEKFPNKPLFILHDSAYVLEEDIPILYLAVKFAYKDYGLTPSLHLEGYITSLENIQKTYYNNAYLFSNDKTVLNNLFLYLKEKFETTIYNQNFQFTHNINENIEINNNINHTNYLTSSTI